MKNILVKEVNMWSNHVNHVAFKSLYSIFDAIKKGAYKDTVSEIRQLYVLGSSKEADNLKKRLHGFVSVGIFDPNKNRKAENLNEYTRVLTLDIDNLLPNQVNEIMERAKAIAYTLMAFVSPSGMGIKILVVVDSRLIDHKEAYEQVSQYYADELGIPLDKQTNDVCRLCYMSYDPSAFINEEATVFNIKLIKLKEVKENDGDDQGSKINRVITFTEKVKKFEKGKRNDFILMLACNCNRYGLSLDKVISHLIEKFEQPDFGKEEIKSTVKSAYNNNRSEFNKWDIDRWQKTNSGDNDEQASFDSPFIEKIVKDNLPDFLKRILNRLKSEREKDVFITGVLTVLSGAINASGYYKEKNIYSHLYSFISAPPASGKGALDYCNAILLPLHKKMKKQSEEQLEEYEFAMVAYRASKGSGAEKPQKPLFQTLFIPANSSTSQMTEHLQSNGEQGIIIETEADTLVKTLDSDFGNYSDVLRKSYHHEMISQRRKTNNEYIEIYNPRLAVALSGTPNQLSKLVESVENGLFSRFIYYVFQTIPKWVDVSPQINNLIPLPELIEETGNVLSDKLLEYRTERIKFRLTKEQWATLNTVFNKRLSEMSCFVGEDASANVFRLGIVAFRLAMVLTVLKMMEGAERKTTVVCDDMEFNMAMSLSETYYQHLLFAFKLIKNKNEVLNISLKKFLEILPNEFDRKIAIECAKGNGISSHERTLDKYLKRLVDYNYLQKNDYNTYKKIKLMDGLKNAA